MSIQLFAHTSTASEAVAFKFSQVENVQREVPAQEWCALGKSIRAKQGRHLAAAKSYFQEFGNLSVPPETKTKHEGAWAIGESLGVSLKVSLVQKKHRNLKVPARYNGVTGI